MTADSITARWHGTCRPDAHPACQLGIPMRHLMKMLGLIFDESALLKDKTLTKKETPHDRPIHLKSRPLA